MKNKLTIEVGDIVSLTTNRLVKIYNQTLARPYTEEGEVIDKNKQTLTVLVNNVRKNWLIKDVELVITASLRDFSKITLTGETVLNYGNYHKGTKLKNVPAFYLKYLIDYEYIIPDNLTIYISNNWDSILDEIANDNIKENKKNEDYF